jgi:prepilin-type N-terminal cleavage/methylation domain-containing protein
MLKPQTKLKDQKGFTIIEVLIVLAIAGLILLIVFLAVPALQRNSRNTQRKNDVQNILGGLSEYVNNNSGQLPANYAAFSSNVKLGYYSGSSDVSYPATGTPDLSKLNVYKGASCNGNTLVTSGVSSRNIAVMYGVEQSGGTLAATCQAS